MEIFTELIKNQNLSIALGFFDGVHKGHQQVIKKAVDYARQNNQKSAVITFKEHPCCYFWNISPQYILTLEERRNKISALGVDYLYELDFKTLSMLDAQTYLKDVLIKYFSPIAISTGFNHNFGHNKTGNSEFLSQQSSIYGYKYFMSEAAKFDDEIISSTAIRKFLVSGNIPMANNMLGYKFYVKGEVVKGQQLGRKLGFRTANLVYPKELTVIPFGCYSTKVFVNGNVYKGVTNFGVRPTVSDGNFSTLETHILNFNSDIYGQNIMVSFEKLLRLEQKFNSLDDLKKQILKDISLV